VEYHYWGANRQPTAIRSDTISLNDFVLYAPGSIQAENMGQWWPKEHHIGESPLAAVVVEPRNGGPWYEKDADGAECEWGTVLVYEPPRRVVLSWHLNGDFEFVPDTARASEVEVRFISEHTGQTKVELEHRNFERHGESGDRLRRQVDDPRGCSYVLASYTGLIAAAESSS
jgi:uncharacterized protein YndB with AHSA1/START domain